MIFTAIVLLPDNKSKASVPFSSSSADDNGCLASYLLLKELGFNIGRYKEAFNEPENISSLIYINYPGRNISEDETSKILSWVHDKGGCLILAGSYETFFDGKYQEIIASIENSINEYIKKDESLSLFTDIPYGNGSIRIIFNFTMFSNKALRIEGTAQDLVGALWDFNEDTVCFYEYRSTKLPTSEKEYGIAGAFLLLPVPARFILVQLLLSIILYILFTGQRIGPPVINREVEFRPDNENIIGAAALMDRLKLKGMAFSLYVENFISELSSHFRCFRKEDILSSWTNNGYNYKENLDEVLSCAFDNKELLSNMENKEMLRLARTIDLLKKELRYGKKKGR